MQIYPVSFLKMDTMSRAYIVVMKYASNGKMNRGIGNSEDYN